MKAIWKLYVWKNAVSQTVKLHLKKEKKRKKVEDGISVPTEKWDFLAKMPQQYAPSMYITYILGY